MEGGYYFKFFYQRFLISTTGWTEEQIGAYFLLLIYQFDKGSIPNNAKILKRISPKSVKHWKLLSSKFIENKNGELINEFMHDVREDALRNVYKNQTNGKKGGRPKANPTLFENKTQPVTQTITQHETQSESQMKGIPLTINHNTNSKKEKKEPVVVNPYLEMFRRAAGSHINNKELEIEAGKFQNKYPNLHPNQAGALVNTWVSNIGKVITQTAKDTNSFV